MDNKQLGSSIAVMNAKGGVGKSTVTLAIAETLSAYHGKKVLVIDSDAQMSISVMLMPIDSLNTMRTRWKTLVGLLHQALILGQKQDWHEFIATKVSDVDDAESIHLLPGDLRLTLVERAVTEADRHEQMRDLVRSFLAEVRLAYDIILIDCPPGLSLLTEIWLREADYHLAPVKPDFLAVAGLEMFREFKRINPDLKMASTLGILVNMKNMQSAEDERYHRVLAGDAESRCFPQAVPHMVPIQHAARYRAEGRSFVAKYPGSAGEAFRATVHEMLLRISEDQPLQVEQFELQERAPAAAQLREEIALRQQQEAAWAEPEPAPAPVPDFDDIPSADSFALEASGIAARFAPDAGPYVPDVEVDDGALGSSRFGRPPRQDY